MVLKYILWIAPNLNHYKSRFLERLSQTGLELTVIYGKGSQEQGHQSDNSETTFNKISTSSEKEDFQYRFDTYFNLYQQINTKPFDVVLMPLERKFILTILFLLLLKIKYSFKLVSYNHPLVKFKYRQPLFIEILVTKFFYSLYDKIIFYTEQGKNFALTHKLLPKRKAYFANNTLDTESIWQNYSFKVNLSSPKTILFIGRLIQNKRLDLLFAYYRAVKRQLPETRLIIVGDGSESSIVKSEVTKDKDIIWRGAIVDERLIAQEMARSHIILNPGHSGLSIVHSFCYGKPYVTSAEYKNHPPEIDYLADGHNGLLLTGDKKVDVQRIIDLLTSEEDYEHMCKEAFATAKELSIENWCEQMRYALEF